jgi:very-short-patch-repair endonuclease
MSMPVDAVERYASRWWDVVSAEQARRLGLPRQAVQAMARRGRWRRLLRGIYWTQPAGHPSGATMGHAARLFAGGGIEPIGVVAGIGAARIWGLDDARRWWRPEVVLGPRYERPQPCGLTYRFDTVAPADVTRYGGIPVTTVGRTLTELATRLPMAELLVLADAALRTGRLDGLEYLDHPSFRHANGLSESAFESRVRAELLSAGLPPPQLQYEVRHDGRFVARVDLAWPERRLAVEADGAETHVGSAALRYDLQRQNALIAAGWTPLRFTWSALGAIAGPVRAALRAQPHAA